MTADPQWVDSYFRGLNAGSKVSRDESGLPEGSSVTTGCEVSPAQVGSLCETGGLVDFLDAILQARADEQAAPQLVLSAGSWALSGATTFLLPAFSSACLSFIQLLLFFFHLRRRDFRWGVCGMRFFCAF